MFDYLIKDYHERRLSDALSKVAEIVHDKNFENAIVKLQGPGEAVLSPAEKETVKVFKSAPGDGDGVQQEAIRETYA
jgi:hypothetical protein